LRGQQQLAEQRQFKTTGGVKAAHPEAQIQRPRFLARHGMPVSTDLQPGDVRQDLLRALGSSAPLRPAPKNHDCRRGVAISVARLPCYDRRAFPPPVLTDAGRAHR
jgi:hypothetical protein